MFESERRPTTPYLQYNLHTYCFISLTSSCVIQEDKLWLTAIYSLHTPLYLMLQFKLPGIKTLFQHNDETLIEWCTLFFKKKMMIMCHFMVHMPYSADIHLCYFSWCFICLFVMHNGTSIIGNSLSNLPYSNICSFSFFKLSGKCLNQWDGHWMPIYGMPYIPNLLYLEDLLFSEWLLQWLLSSYSQACLLLTNKTGWL